MSHHKTRKSKSRSRKNKTRGGAKGLGRRTPSYKEKRRTSSTVKGSTYNPPKVNTNAKHAPPHYAIPKKEWNALTEYQKQMSSVHGVGPNK